MPKYWQHENPLKCPNNHKMYWLGSVYWICDKCLRPDGKKKGIIWVQVPETTIPIQEDSQP